MVFWRKFYENALAIALRKSGLKVEQQKNIKVYYETEEVGDYYADLLVENLVIIEVKAAKALSEDHEAQLINYRKATAVEVGLLINFGKQPSFKRKIFENQFKKNLIQSN